MKNADYWRARFAILEESAHRRGDRYLRELEDVYRGAEQSVRKEIESWYQRFAANNRLTLTEARRMLTAGQLEEFRWTAEQYVKAAQKANLSPDWIKKLENASARYHISRLETIQLQIQQQLELLFGNQVDGIDALLREIVSNGYTRGAYEIQKGIGLGWDFTALSEEKLSALLSKPWTTDGRTFRDRCWTNKAELVDAVNKELIQGLLRGDPPAKAITAIQKRFGTSRYKAGRLVHTETTYFNAVSKIQMYRDLSVAQIEIVETLDSRTCEICGPLDGTVIPLSQYEPGVTVPPFHPNCRGTTCPHYDDMDGERAARNAGGKVYYIPANTTYSDWKRAFADGGSKSGLTLASSSDTVRTNEKRLDTERIKQIMTEQVQVLPDEQKKALQEYTGFMATRINRAIGENRITPKIQAEIELLDKALQDGVMPETVVLHRDTMLSYLKLGLSEKPSADELALIVGQNVTNQIFTSTSFENLHLQGRNTEIWLTVPKGYKGCQYVKPVATWKYQHQDEVLFSRGMRCIVTKAELKNGKYILWAEVVL